MSRVHLVLLWHMHQPQYRDPQTRRYVLPWTRLHALKDYWGMVRALEPFPHVHATFNIVPSLAVQIEEYASGKFRDPWFDVALKAAEELDDADKRAILERAFQVNYERLMSRWPRFVELFHWSQRLGAERAVQQFSIRDWRDLQLLSQLAWMDEEYLAGDPVVSALARQGANFSEQNKENFRKKHDEVLRDVLPEYRRAAERGQIEISTTPFYHPILPLLCDSEIARVANPYTPSLFPPFRFPEDAREQLTRAREYHRQLFGLEPQGLWPSEGSVSSEVLRIAADLGFRWFATDEGVLGRTRNIGFWRDGAGIPENARELYSPWRFHAGGKEIYGFFRDHYLSDLIGFVYSRMQAAEAAADFHRRLRDIGARFSSDHPATVCVILDGENAWEYYPGNGREFLRQVYGRIADDADIRALTMSEAIAATRDISTLEGIFPASWINANFDVWIGHSEDIRAWELLRGARQTYADVLSSQRKTADGPAPDFVRAREALLAAEGSDWCWWYGPEHSSSNDQEFDQLYRKHLQEVYAALGREVPQEITQPIKRVFHGVKAVPPTDWIAAKVDGRVSSYFEWLGAGYYARGRRGGAMHGHAQFLNEIFYGFSDEFLFIRVDPLRQALGELPSCEFKLVFEAQAQVEISIRLENGKVVSYFAKRTSDVLALADEDLRVAADKVLELRLARRLFALEGQAAIRFSASLWSDGLPLDLLPREGSIELPLGEEFFAWPASRAHD